MTVRIGLLAAIGLIAAGCTSGGSADDVPLELTTTTTTESIDTDPVEPTDEVTASVVLAAPSDFELAGPPDAPVVGRLPDLTGETILILGPETASDAESFEAGFAPFEAATGADVVYEGTQDDTRLLDEAIAAGDPPDIAVVAQPGRLFDLARAGSVRPLPASIVDTVRADYDPLWADLVTLGERTYGVPNRASVKSLIWYDPARFDRSGYEVPETWDELTALAAEMRANNDVPWCIGIASGEATGWVFTDWVEDVMLRLHGPDVYDDWVNHDIGFDDARVLAAIDVVSDVWFEPGNVLGGRGSVTFTTFAEAGLPLLDGGCLMHRQASFYAGAYRDAGADLGPSGDVDVFALPSIDADFSNVVMGAGNYLAAFTDREATDALLAFFASPAYADARVASGAGGFVSPNRRADPELQSPGVERDVAEIIRTADPFRYDGSDLMPAVIGTNEFWRAATTYVIGGIDAQDLVDRVESSWPT